MLIIQKLKRIVHILSEQKYQEKCNIALIERSPLFDKKWYLAKNPDVKAAKIRAAKHYYKIGFKEGRNPSPMFDNNNYLEKYPDVVALGINPLLHYIQEGKRKGYVYCTVNGREIPTEHKSFWEKVCYALEYPIRLQADCDRLTTQLKMMKNTK